MVLAILCVPLQKKINIFALQSCHWLGLYFPSCTAFGKVIKHYWIIFILPVNNVLSKEFQEACTTRLRNICSPCHQMYERSFHKLGYCSIHLYPIKNIGLCPRNWYAIMLRTIFCTLYFSPLLYRLYWNLNDCVFVWYIWSVGIEGKTNLFTLPHYMGLIINLNLKCISRLGWRATWSRSNGWIFRTPSVLVLCVGFAGVKDAAGRSLSKFLHFDEGSAMVKEMNASGNTSLICHDENEQC